MTISGERAVCFVQCSGVAATAARHTATCSELVDEINSSSTGSLRVAARCGLVDWFYCCVGGTACFPAADRRMGADVKK